MKDKICLITGATSGIGKVTAIELAKKGAQIVLLGRNAKKLQQAKDDIMRDTGNISIDIIIANLSSIDQIHQAAATFNKSYTHLDVLINNAGFIAGRKRATTEDGFEETIMVNYLAPVLLTHLLLDKLKASADARIINVASAAHAAAKPDLDDLQMKRHYSAIRAYGNSKLYLMLYTRHLAAKLRQFSNITVNSLHPGFVASNFSKSSGGLMHWAFKLLRPFQISLEKGAETTLYLATATEAANYTGQYFINKKPFKPHNKYLTTQNQEKLWKLTQQVLQITMNE